MMNLLKDIIECKTSEKTKSIANKKAEIFQQISERVFDSKKSASQIKTCWNNMRARAVSKD